MENKIKKVYMLYHTNQEKDQKLIGFFSSKEKAEKYKEILSEKPGFKDFKEGFKIKAMLLNKDYHQKGFNSKCLGKGDDK